ncbi:MAG: RHS repeat-associated core domain-containing protein, partial [Dehalococcoidia bacterium]
FRYDSSRLGRFLTPDPIAGSPLDPQSLNRYAYVRNDPVNLSDPLGLFYSLWWPEEGGGGWSGWWGGSAWWGMPSERRRTRLPLGCHQHHPDDEPHCPGPNPDRFFVEQALCALYGICRDGGDEPPERDPDPSRGLRGVPGIDGIDPENPPIPPHPCEFKILDRVNAEFGTNLTSTDVIGRPDPSTSGGTVNVVIQGTNLTAGQFNAIRPRRISGNALGTSSTLHIPRKDFSRSNVGGRRSTIFRAHLDSGNPLDLFPIPFIPGGLVHGVQDVLTDRGGPCP